MNVGDGLDVRGQCFGSGKVLIYERQNSEAMLIWDEPSQNNPNWWEAGGVRGFCVVTKMCNRRVLRDRWRNQIVE